MAQMPIATSGFGCTRCGEQLPHHEAQDQHNFRSHLLINRAASDVGGYQYQRGHGLMSHVRSQNEAGATRDTTKLPTGAGNSAQRSPRTGSRS